MVGDGMRMNCDRNTAISETKNVSVHDQLVVLVRPGGFFKGFLCLGMDESG